MAVTSNNTFTAFSRQVANRNFLSPVGFKFNLSKTPKVDFFSQSVSIPNINVGVSIQTTYLKDIPVPGDKMDYGDLDIEFFIDENLENYLQIEKWMRSLGFPESIGESIPLDPNEEDLLMGARSDGSLLIYNSNFQPIAKINFKDLFPIALTPVPFSADATDINYIMATAVSYTHLTLPTIYSV